MVSIIKMTLATTQEDFDGLHQAAAGVRVDVGTVTVSKQALANILYDHSQLVGVCEEDFREWIQLVHGSPQETHIASKILQEYRCTDVENE